MDIRRAKPEDAHAIWQAEWTTSQVPGQLVSHPEEISLADVATKIRSINQRGYFVVAEQADRLLGHGMVEPMGLIALQHVYRLMLVVHPGDTGRGIGTALLQHIQAWAAARPGLHKIELLVRATNVAAIRLYTRLGFRQEGVLRDRVRLPSGEFVDDFTMGWFPAAPPTQ